MPRVNKPFEPEGMKYCVPCKVLKPIEEFGKSRAARCKQCNKEATTKHKEKYPERIVARSARYYQENKERLNTKRRLRGHKYNPSCPSNSPENLHKKYLKKRAEGKIQNKVLVACKSEKTYAQMLKEQNGKCAICGYQPAEGERALAVDHSHAENRVRKLLCQWCNTGLGMFKEHPESLENAIRYIENHSREQGA